MRSTARGRAGAFAADAAGVVLFAAAGRASHDDDPTIGGVAWTALPFLVALALGWLATLAWRAPLAPLRAGAPVWAVTVVGGMIGRVLLGEGTATSFVVVATLTLLTLLVGWRLVAALVGRVRARSSGARPARR